MDVFSAICKGLNATKEECSWIKNLFKVISDDVYKPSFYNNKPSEELCLDVLSVILRRTGDRIPINHTVLSVSSLSAFEDGKHFTGNFGEKSVPLPASDQITGYHALEERHLILMGFLTELPTSEKPTFPEMGMLYLEDNKSVIMFQPCDECGTEKHLLNNLVILPKWNFIDTRCPILVYESERGKSGPNRLKYIELVERMICIGRLNLSVIPKALSLEEFSKMEIKTNKERINIVGTLKTLSSTHLMYQQKPYFFAQLKSPDETFSTSIAFWGHKFVPWYHLMQLEETYVITQVRKTTMNKGQPSERVVLAAEKRSHIFKVDAETCASNEETSSTASDNGSQGLKRKRDEMESETEGTVTAILNSDFGLYEMDNRYRLYTVYVIWSNFGCGMRVGAFVTLHNVHLCQMDQEVLGFACCNSSTIKIVKPSMLDSQFQFCANGSSYIGHLFHRLSLLDYIKAHELCERLSKKFLPNLSATDIIGPKHTWDSVGPTILSHVLDLEAIKLPPRDMFNEFFSDPHRCIVTTPFHRATIPTPLTLKDLMSLVDGLGTQGENSGLTIGYRWSFREITQKELPEDLVLLGWISNKNLNGQLCFCDATSSIPCLIVESEIPEAVHKCDAGCFVKRHDMNGRILPRTDQEMATCPLPKTSLLGAILKLPSFRIIIETFSGQEILNNGKATTNKDPLRKIYLVFSAREAVVIGNVPGFDTVPEKQKVDVSEKQKVDVSEKQKVDVSQKKKVDVSEKQKVDVSQRKKVDVSEKQKVGVSEKQKVDVSEKQKVDVSQKKKVDVSEKQKVDVSEKQKVGVSAKRKVDVSEKQKVDVSEKKRVDVSEKQKVDVSEKQKMDVSEKHKMDVSEKPKLDVSKKQKMDVSEKQKVDVSEKQKMHVSEKQKVDVSEKQKVDVSKKQKMDVSKKQNVDVSEKQKVDVSKKQKMDVSEKQKVDVSEKRKVDVSKKQKMDVSEKQKVDVSEKRKVDVSKKQKMDVSEKQKVDVSEKQKVDVSKKQKMDVSEKQKVDVSEKQKVDVSKKQKMDVSEKQKVDVSEKQKVVDISAWKDKNKQENVTGCKSVFLVKHKELEAVRSKSRGQRLTTYVHGYILGERERTSGTQKDREGQSGSHGAKKGQGSDSVSLGTKEGKSGSHGINEGNKGSRGVTEGNCGDMGSHGANDGKSGGTVAQGVTTKGKAVKKQEIALQFTNKSGWLDFLHQGRLYYLIEQHDPIFNTCHVKETFEKIKALLPMNSNLRFEEIDDRARSRDDYEDLALLAEPLVKLNSVRAYLSKWENTDTSLISHKILVSFRGKILKRETVLTNEDQFSIPTSRSGELYLHSYGHISASHASSISLGFCYLGNRKVMLIVQDVLTADSVKLYLDFSTRRYPMGLLPGAVVSFRHLLHRLSKYGNIYLSLEPGSGIEVEALPTTSKKPSDLPKPAYRNSPQPDALIESRDIRDFYTFQSLNKVTYTLSHVVCRIVAVQKVLLKWTCSRCGRLCNNCYCQTSKSQYDWIFIADARCVIEDGTGEAMVFMEDPDVVKRMLFVSDSAWVEIQNMTKKPGQILYQRCAHWMDGDVNGDTKADRTLSSMATSPKLCRNIKILCKQFKMAPLAGYDTRNIRVDRNEQTTRVAQKITLKVLKLHEVNYKCEVRSMIAIATMRKDQATYK